VIGALTSHAFLPDFIFGPRKVVALVLLVLVHDDVLDGRKKRDEEADNLRPFKFQDVKVIHSQMWMVNNCYNMRKVISQIMLLSFRFFHIFFTFGVSLGMQSLVNLVQRIIHLEVWEWIRELFLFLPASNYQNK